MWASILLAVASLVLLLVPSLRANSKILAAACSMVFLSLWIDKGLGLIVGGFVPTPLGEVTEYFPTLPEISITLGVWAFGFLIVTVLYKIALSVRGEMTATH
jgi:molybdopterin-containing oxidoreductase family membrane subunit